MRKFERAVKWEFKSLIGGEGRNVREAYLDALERSYEAAQHASDFVMEAVERNELWTVDGKFAERDRIKPTPTPTNGHTIHGMRPTPELRYGAWWAVFAVVVFAACSWIFYVRYQELQSACLAHGHSAEYCWDLGR